MKKFVFLPVILCILLLTGCTGSSETAQTGSFSVLREELVISLDAPAAPVLEALGAPFGYSEAKSTSYGGVEKNYRFRGINLRTYESQDGERIMGLLITDSTIPTQEGLTIGDTAERVQACYGSDPIQNGCCTIRRSNQRMTVLLQNNVVTSIQYALV